jgi:uncharacterized phiE125 gp8 family phage protein
VLTVADLQAHARPDPTANDNAYQTALLAAVESYVCEYLDRSLQPTALREWYDCIPQEFQVHRGPVTAVTAIKAYDLNDNVTTVATTVYQTDFIYEPARVSLRFGQIWPYQLRARNAVAIEYTAGYAVGAVPAGILQAMKILLGHWYEERQPTAVGYVSTLPFSVEALLAPFRISTGVA